MKYKGTLIVVKDCNRALKFYSDMFGFQLLQDNDGNMELTNNLYLQESRYWEQFTKRSVIPRPSQTLCKPPMWCRIGAPHWRFL